MVVNSSPVSNADSLLRSSTPSKAKSNSKYESKYKLKFNQFMVPKNDSQGSLTPAMIDQQERSNQPLTNYAADPVNPNPSYTHHTIEQSVKTHTVINKAYLDDFDAKMAKWDG
jgi:hypothetical protein